MSYILITVMDKGEIIDDKIAVYNLTYDTNTTPITIYKKKRNGTKLYYYLTD